MSHLCLHCGLPPLLERCERDEASIRHKVESQCPTQLSVAAWRRYFRPNEGHMVQGLAPSGCSYLAGKSQLSRQYGQMHAQHCQWATWSEGSTHPATAVRCC